MVPYFVYPLFVGEHLGCFRLLTIVNNATMSISVPVSVESLVSIILGIYPKVEFAGSHHSSMFNFEEPTNGLSQRLRHFTFPSATHKGTFPHSH